MRTACSVESWRAVTQGLAAAGSGKTRLVLEYAAGLGRLRFGGGVRFVDLAPLGSTDDPAAAVAAALDVALQPGDVANQVGAALRAMLEAARSQLEAQVEERMRKSAAKRTPGRRPVASALRK